MEVRNGPAAVTGDEEHDKTTAVRALTAGRGVQRLIRKPEDLPEYKVCLLRGEVADDFAGIRDDPESIVFIGSGLFYAPGTTDLEAEWRQ